MKHKSYPDLDIEEDLSFERKNWVSERIAWILLTLFVLAALAGFFGRGGISNATAGTPGQGLEVKYQRYLRFHTPETLEISVPDAGHIGTYSLNLNSEWLEAVQIENIHPQPQTQKATAFGTELGFSVEQGGKPIKLYIFYKPEKIGPVKAVISTPSGASVSLSQFIYP